MIFVQVNVDSRTLESTLKLLNDDKTPRRHAFSPAEEHVFTLMSKDSYPRFVRSQIYKGVLSAAQQQVIDRFSSFIHAKYKI